jgi:hypothetical protein
MSNNTEELSTIDLSLVEYFLKKFTLNCKKGFSREILEKDIKQLQMIIDSFIIYNLIRNGQIQELNDQNSDEILKYFGD